MVLKYKKMIGTWQAIIIITFIIVLIITLWALIDIARSEFSGNNKVVWVLIVLFTNFLGAVLYFFIGRKQKIKH
ncbi:PLD nuclease N-terminal domain-containing protein [Psychroflexus sp. CAK57W]|uniref:PLD nuclease N-terminal domain-containing protein n=1 Tax=Psychroflexus curvus TaxID=2873595 RepID=UPI001CC9E892|nr:PLD nuclease N-terminal domain-containing protein [Psychroflexus curvus]MBZ9627411.1 PLD nuclease N-terminal domain-containing protein [Psychroflexus curvus]MBZ9785918.1 PLD nuclease N-terminal domain-containing protein [Psychroflexus curvus]